MTTDIADMDPVTLASHMMDIGGLNALATVKYMLETDRDVKTVHHAVVVINGATQAIVEIAASEGRVVIPPTSADVAATLED